MSRRWCAAVLFLAAWLGGCATRVQATLPALPAHAEQAGAAPTHSFAAALRDLRASRYDAAERALSVLVQIHPKDGRARLALARLRLETGRYAAAAADAGVAARLGRTREVEARVVQAEALWRAGQHESAVSVLRPFQNDHPEAQRLLGELLLDSGNRAEAEPVLIRIVEAYNDGRIRESDGLELALVGRAAHLLRSPEDANEAYLLAERVAPDDIRLLLWRAELFLDAHDPEQAEEVIQKALQFAPNQPDVLTLLAHIKLDQALDFGRAEELVAMGLAGNPNHARGFFVKAGLALRDSEITDAEAILETGLEHNPNDLALLSMRAAARFLAEDTAGFAAIERFVLARSPSYSEFYRIVGTYADWEHRYTELVELMSRATAIDPEDAEARAILGINLIRAGKEREGVHAIEQAFEEDPFDLRIVNTLNLYEKVIASDYVTVEGPRFRIRYHRQEQQLLERYVPELLDRAWSALRDAHGFEPRVPIGVELYAERESFAVRTNGLPHTAISGVCFGETLAAMTPRQESFNFGMTLWHEVAHVFHLQLSRSRVPRWFTEGFAEYETTLARPEWRREHDPELYQALRDDRLPQVAQMNRAFTHAKRAEDVVLAYYASSRLVSSLASRHGRSALTQLLRGWGEGKPTEVLLRSVLGRDAKAIDAEFREFLGTELGRYDHQFLPPAFTTGVAEARVAVERAPTSVEALLELALANLGAGHIEDSKRAVERARKAAGKRPPPRLMWLEAQMAFAEGQPVAAAAVLARLIASGQDGSDVRMMLARLAASRSDAKAEKAELERARALDPSQSQPLARLAILAGSRGDTDEEIALLEELALIEQHDASVYRQLMARLLERGRFDDASRWGEAALWVDIRGFKTHRLRAQAFDGVGETARALFELESALLCEAPERALAEAHRRAEGLCRRLGRARDAMTHYERAVALERNLR